MKRHTFYLISLILLAVLSRLIAPWPNFTAMTAVAIAGGFLFGRRLEGIILPLLALFLSDLIINNTLYAHYGNTWLTEGAGWLYGSYLLIALLGSLRISKSKNAHLFVSGIVGSILFFLITNFGSWLANPLYPQNFAGLLQSYTAGIPFLLNQIAGTVVYVGVIIAGAYFVQQRIWLKAERVRS